MPQGLERQQYLEILGGLDMNAWIVGRQPAPLHIWATYCRGGEGIEDVTGLPRHLLDLISLVSRREDVLQELKQYAEVLPQTHDKMTGVYRSLILSAQIYLHQEPVAPLLSELFTLVRCLRQEITGADLGILAFPAYTLEYHGQLLEYRTLAVDVLSTPSTTYLPDGVLEFSLAGDCDSSEVGLCPPNVADYAWSRPHGLVEKPGMSPGVSEAWVYCDEYDIEVIRDGHKPKTVFLRTGLKGQTFETPADAYAVGCNWPEALSLHLEVGNWPSAFYLR
ncbi:hypothetical protein FACUT_12942 [Fusarium acutatum]|uniref:Uncharacterized protein n=1 Tax=Fusarium acutatum TaxID=78861 RepID=A0A8H4NBA6_9HYPO|nr:hypothetical protein FACUT_12942 [Fusarium acutatum]